MTPVQFQKLTLIGVGLLGGSIGLAAKQRGVAHRVCGLVRREESIAECLATGAVDEATLDITEAVTDANLVILCTPVGRMGELVAAMKPHLSAGADVTDVGSVKAPVVAAVGDDRFIGGLKSRRRELCASVCSAVPMGV